MLKRLINAVLIIAVIILTVFVGGCASEKNGTMKVITNQSGAAGGEGTIENGAGPGDGDTTPPVIPEGKEKPGDIQNSGGQNSKDDPGGAGTAGKSGPGTNKEVKYGGYKGPVQGEVKYQEGTPAAENSADYKASGDIESGYRVDLFVTSDYGRKKMFGKTVGLVLDEVGMEVMFRNLDIQTAYGGGFVNSINGLESGYTFFTGSERKKYDWFYWVNGILAPVGVAEYRPVPGDVIWWDYHDWSTTMFIPAVIGSYPQPFKNGFGGKNPGTVIMYAPDYAAGAGRLKKSLEARGVSRVDVAEYDPAAIKAPQKHYILLGSWQELAGKSDFLQDVNTKNKLVGFYIKFQDGELKALDHKGKTISSHPLAGAVCACGSPGSICSVWLVTGTDRQGVELALDTMLNRPEALREHFGAVITKDGVINVPYVD